MRWEGGRRESLRKRKRKKKGTSRRTKRERRCSLFVDYIRGKETGGISFSMKAVGSENSSIREGRGGAGEAREGEGGFFWGESEAAVKEVAVTTS